MKKWLKSLFEPDYARTTRHMKEHAAELEAQYTEFIARARDAGFTGPQADFMWTYLSLNNHVHEYSTQTTGFRSLTKPPLNRKNAR
jgi:hypothetical protein